MLGVESESRIDQVRILLSEVSLSERELVISELTDRTHRTLCDIFQSVKEVIHFRPFKGIQYEAIRHTLISSCCSPQIDLKSLAKALGLYGNRNYLS